MGCADEKARALSLPILSRHGFPRHREPPISPTPATASCPGLNSRARRGGVPRAAPRPLSPTAVLAAGDEGDIKSPVFQCPANVCKQRVTRSSILVLPSHFPWNSIRARGPPAAPRRTQKAWPESPRARAPRASRRALGADPANPSRHRGQTREEASLGLPDFREGNAAH